MIRLVAIGNKGLQGILEKFSEDLGCNKGLSGARSGMKADCAH